MILDTNALSAVADNDPAIIPLLARADQITIPVIALGGTATASHNRGTGPATQPG